MSAYPVPLKALKGLKPNRDKTPNYITKLGRTGIKPIDLPIYSPASVRSLANSISNISKLERDFVSDYLENMIDDAERERIEEIMNEPDDDIVMVDAESQTRASALEEISERMGSMIESDPMFADEREELGITSPVREIKAVPSRFKSGGGKARAGVGVGGSYIRDPDSQREFDTRVLDEELRQGYLEFGIGVEGVDF
jgi:hypothetical protein